MNNIYTFTKIWLDSRGFTNFMSMKAEVRTSWASSFICNCKPTLFFKMMAFLLLTSNARTAFSAPTYSISPSLLSSNVVVLLTSGVLKMMRFLPGLPFVIHRLTQGLSLFYVFTVNKKCIQVLTGFMYLI